ncbi:MAG: FIST N-terminal domain-containing protein [Bradymonadia bacterium]
MEWVSALSEAADLSAAIEATVEDVQSRMEGAPDIVFAFPSADYEEAISGIVDALDRAWPGVIVMGCTAGGVVGDGREFEGPRGLALTAAQLPGVEITTFVIESEQLPEADAGPEAWSQLIGVSADALPHFVVTPDPFTFDAERLIRGIDATWPQSTLVGGLASGGRRPGGHLLFAGDRVVEGGAVGVAFTGDIAVETVVAQGCRPIGHPMFITRGSGNIISELDGQPATEVLAELFEGLSPEDKGLFRNALFLGLVMDPEQQMYSHGDFLIRNIMGVDPTSGILAVGARINSSQVIQFHLRDARTSEDDLRALLKASRDRGDRAPAGALIFSCLGRGEGLYGQPDLESRVIQGTMGPVPTGGFFCNGEIGPVHGRTFLHGYTSALALFRPKNCQ